MIIKTLINKKLLIFNVTLSFLFAFCEIIRVLKNSNILKPAKDTILFILITITTYFFIFFGIVILISLLYTITPKNMKQFFPSSILLVIFDVVIVIALFYSLFSAEPDLIENKQIDRFNKGNVDSLPNILLVTIDTLRQDHLSSTGYKDITTPSIDFFSKNGITFSNAQCQIPVTTPSHSSILTGLNPYIHKSRNNGTPISDNVTTITEVLSKIGYITAAFVSGSTLQAKLSGLNMGFEYYDQFLCPRFFDQRLYLLMFGKLALKLGLYDGVEKSAERTNEAVLHWLKKNSGKKFFLWVHYFDAHAPYNKHNGLSSAYLDGEKFDLKADYKLINSIYDGVYKPSQAEINYIISLYDGEIMFVDRHLGKLMKALREMDIFDNTLMILTADHGESLGEHNYYFYHGSKLYDPSLKVPLFFMGHGLERSGSIIEKQVRLIDIAPSIMSIIRNDYVWRIDGSSLFPLASIDSPPRLSYSENVNKLSFTAAFTAQKDNMLKKRAIRINEEKYIDNPNDEMDEFYDLASDPRELTNILKYKSDVENYKNLISDIKEKFENQDNSPKSKLDKKALEDLKTLGYVN
ncbi:sulfatase [bacterium]|nr:sulfatase [bacterium]